jgi:hypothetical protein
MITEVEEKAISPEWLETKGFARYQEGVEYEDNYFPGANFDVGFNKDALCYVEKKLHRNRFCVVLTPMQYEGGGNWYGYEAWIQVNIGCGWVNIPNNFTEMTEHHFSLLFEAIRREKL